MLGISERAVRKRIETNQLLAVKEERAWVVLLDPGTAGGAVLVASPTPSGTTPTTAPPTEPGTAGAASTADSWWGDAVPDTFGDSAEGHAVPDSIVAVPAVLDAVPVPPVDLTPLVNLVADLTRRNAELTEAATIWQIRAHDLDQRLKQLTAGGDGVAGDQRQDAPERPPEPPGSTEGASEGDPSSSWWATMLRKVHGGG